MPSVSRYKVPMNQNLDLEISTKSSYGTSRPNGLSPTVSQSNISIRGLPGYFTKSAHTGVSSERKESFEVLVSRGDAQDMISTIE